MKPSAGPQPEVDTATPRSGAPSDGDLAAKIEGFLSALARVDAQGRRDLGLNANERTSLLHLANGVSSPTELAGHLGMTTAGTTNLLDRLVANGYVSRERHASDGRRVLLVLTKQGIRAHMRLQDIAEELATLAAHEDVAVASELGRFLDAATRLLDARSASFGG